MSDRNAAKALYNVTPAKFGGVDILVNNTGGPPAGSVITPDSDTWRSYFDMIVVRISTARTLSLDTAAAEKQGKTLAEVEAASRADIPAKRYGNVEEFGATAAFLCSAQAGYITGAAIRVDGGAIASV